MEPARRHESWNLGHQVGDRLAAAIVVHGGQVSCRFVQGEVSPGLGQAHRAAVEFDLIRGLYRGAQARRLAVYLHATGEYRGLRLAARGRCPGAGEESLQTHYESSLPASEGEASEDTRRSRTRASSSWVTSASTGGKSSLEEAPVAARNSSVIPRSAGGFAVGPDFGQEVAFDQAAHHRVRVYAANAGDGTPREWSEVERAGQYLVGCPGEGRGPGLPPKALHGFRAGRIRREQVAAGDFAQHYPRRPRRITLPQAGEGALQLPLAEAGRREEVCKTDGPRAHEEDRFDQVG